MTELFLIIKDFTNSNPLLVTWAVAGFLLVIALLSQKEWIKEFFSEFKLNRMLKSIGHASLHNVSIPDGIDGKIFIENLILLSDKIVLLGVKKYRGVIFAADNIDLWTQVIGNKSYKFDNPLRQLENDAMTLSAKLDGTKLKEKVLFIKGSEFPKGKPEDVVTINEIKKIRQENVGCRVPESLQRDWDSLCQLVVTSDVEQENGILLDENTSTLNMFSLVTFSVLIALWLTWRLM